MNNFKNLTLSISLIFFLALTGVTQAWVADTAHDKERVEFLKSTGSSLNYFFESIGIESIETRATRIRNEQEL